MYLLVRRPVHIILMLFAIFISGCASVPFDHPKQESQVTRVSDATNLGRYSLEWVEVNGKQSGFVPLTGGNDALGVRLKLMEGAEESIDAQYFLLKPDQAGKLFIGGLLRAADRGVRVRFLLDDIFTPDIDSQLTLLNSHPNIEVRLFNPLTRQSFKYWSLLVDFSRANRRMHNKLFVADDAFAVLGGRNIAEEYFEVEPEVEFADFDVLAIGSVVSEAANTFDKFWNNAAAVPIEAFEVPVDPQELDVWRQIMDEIVSGERESVYQRAINSKLLQDIVGDRAAVFLGEAHVFTDSPEKLKNKKGLKEFQTVVNELARRMNEATSEVLLVTPYFIPGKEGTAFIEGILAKGVSVVIVTNSLSSTNHLPVHSGYARYREQLIAAGAKIYEIKADVTSGNEEIGLNPDKVTLHTKVAIVDRETFFVGSLNLDPRSIEINTEMGAFIESPELSASFAQEIDEGLAEATYSVILDDNDKLRWIYDYQEQYEEHSREPYTSVWQRFKVGFYQILPIEGQL